MALSHRERQILAEIELDLIHQDRAFSRRFDALEAAASTTGPQRFACRISTRTGLRSARRDPADGCVDVRAPRRGQELHIRAVLAANDKHNRSEPGVDSSAPWRSPAMLNT